VFRQCSDELSWHFPTSIQAKLEFTIEVDVKCDSFSLIRRHCSDGLSFGSLSTSSITIGVSKDVSIEEVEANVGSMLWASPIGIVAVELLAAFLFHKEYNVGVLLERFIEK
jgi:hypothetical protein